MKANELYADSSAAVVFPDLIKITGGVTSAILLSRLINWCSKGSSEESWIIKKDEEIEQDPAIGKSALEAITQLKDKGCIEEQKVTSSIGQYRVNSGFIREAIASLLAGLKNSKAPNEVTEDGIVLSFEMIQDAGSGTPYADIDHKALEGFVDLNGLKKVIETVDILAAQYRTKPEPPANPILVLAKALLKGASATNGHVSYFERLRMVTLPDSLVSGMSGFVAPAVKPVRVEKPARSAEADQIEDSGDEIASPWRGMM